MHAGILTALAPPLLPYMSNSCRHSGKADNIMQEVPTVVVDPMPESYFPHRDYVVLNRPYAVNGAGWGSAGR